jgi:hypothetical protein
MSDTRSDSRNGEQRPRTRPLAQVEIERGIVDLCDDLEHTTEEYARVSDEQAEAENAYKRKYTRALVSLGSVGVMPDGRKSTTEWREAQASITAEDEGARHRILEARLRATKEALITKRARLDALRTIAANVRSMGG